MHKKEKPYKYKHPLDSIVLPPHYLAEEIYKQVIEKIKQRDQEKEVNTKND